MYTCMLLIMGNLYKKREQGLAKFYSAKNFRYACKYCIKKLHNMHSYRLLRAHTITTVVPRDAQSLTLLTGQLADASNAKSQSVQVDSG